MKQVEACLSDAAASVDFDAKRYLDEYLKSSSGDLIRNLKTLRSAAQQLSDSYSNSLKKNVFCNYDQFVQTASVVLDLQNELVTFGNLLTDQKALIETLKDLSFGHSIEELRGFGQRMPERRNVVQQLLETVENCQLKDNDMELVFESDLTQLNPDNMLALQIFHAFLFTDGLMLATFLPKRLRSVRYKYFAFYELENVAFINVKNSDAWQNVFKVLIFPEQLYFSCESSLTKKQWFDWLEKAKRNMLRQGSLLRQATIRVKSSRRASNKLIKNENVEKKKSSVVDTEWLKELPDELDVCIAQRDFDSALELLTEGRDCLAECDDKALAEDLEKKFYQKQKQLTEKLITELKPTSDKYLQGGPRAMRKAIILLVKLGKVSEACDLYLKNRSLNIKFSVKELKVIDNAVQYVEQLNRTICNVVIETVRDFTKLFAGYDLCFSVLIVWASGELKNYANLFTMQVFDSGCCLSVAASCLAMAFASFECLADLNLDLRFQLEMLFHPPITKLVGDAERLLIDAVNLRMTEDRWRPFNLQSEANVAKYVNDFRESGLDISNMACDGCRLWLTSQMCNFARAVLPFCRHLGALRAAAPSARLECEASIKNVWSVQLNYLNKKVAVGVDKKVHEKNIHFAVGYLLPLCQESYRSSARLALWNGLFELLERCSAQLLPIYKPFVDNSDTFETIGYV